MPQPVSAASMLPIRLLASQRRTASSARQGLLCSSTTQHCSKVGWLASQSPVHYPQILLLLWFYDAYASWNRIMNLLKLTIKGKSLAERYCVNRDDSQTLTGPHYMLARGKQAHWCLPKLSSRMCF